MFIKWILLLGSIALLGVFFWLLGDAEAGESNPGIYYGLRGGVVFFFFFGLFWSE
jgi:hypothetical protein